MSSNPARSVALLLAGGLALAALGGCGGGSEPSGSAPPSAQTRLCTSADELDAAASRLGDLGVESTRDQVEQAIDGFVVAIADVTDDLGAVGGAGVAAIQQSFESVSDELENLPGDATIADELSTIRQAVPAMQAALDQALSGVDCDGAALGRDVS
jgi:hypothetical protein